MFRPVERHELPLVSTRAAKGLVFGLETGSEMAMVLEYASALELELELELVLGLELELELESELGPASQLVRELGLALVMAFLERLASGSVGRVERVQSQHCCSAC